MTGSLAGSCMLGAFEDQKSSDSIDEQTKGLAKSRISLENRPSTDFFGAHGDSEGFEGLDDPGTPLQELTAFVTGLFSRENLPWLAIRAIPIALVLIAGVMFWPSSGEESTTELSIRATNAPTPQVELAEIAPGLSYTARNPELFVELGADGIAGTGDEPGLLAEQDAASEDADNPENGLEEQATSTTAAGASIGPADQTTTTDRTTTTEAANGNTTAAPATTTNPATTAAPTTPAPTDPPTTPAPTTAPPTTPPTTSPPTTPPTTPPPTQPPSNNCGGGGEFERIFRDDFNGSSIGGGWSKYNSAGNAGYGLRRPSAITAQNGNMVITARMENGSLVSGGMSQAIHQTYGKYVVRVRTDNDPSQAVSGVVLTWPSSGAHPRDGENNIYETLVQTPNRNPFFTFIHKPFGSHSDQEYKEHHADGSQFQTMTMEWTPNRITIIREGTGSSDTWTVNETGADLIPDVNHHLAIQLDGWKHSIGGDVRMEVDFVEIYKYCG